MKLTRLCALLASFCFIATPSFAASKDHSYDCTQQLDSRVESGTALVLSYCFLQDADMPKVAAYLSKHTNIRDLNIYGNWDLTEKGYQTLAKALTYIDYIDLGDTDITYAGLEAILKSHQFYYINLSDNAMLSPKNGSAALTLLANQYNLNEFDMNDSDLTDAGAIQIASAFAGHSMLKKIDLEHDNIGVNGATALANLQGLNELRLDNNNIRDAGAINIAKSSNALAISLANNKITDQGAAAFANNWKPAASDNYWLDLGDNSITDQGAFAFANNTIPVTFDLGLNYNMLTDAGINALKNTKNIFEFYYVDNDHEGMPAQSSIKKSMQHYDGFNKRAYIINSK